ncbi:hypothetical protein DXG01_002538, partial [Tephrocybe rancida]
HRYLENSKGAPISREHLAQVGRKARRLWVALMAKGMAPLVTWRKAAGEDVHAHFASAMVNDPIISFFRSCDNHWKLIRWAGKAFSSWSRNHLETDRRARKKAKHETPTLDDSNLWKMDDGPLEKYPATLDMDIEDFNGSLTHSEPPGRSNSNIVPPSLSSSTMESLVAGTTGAVYH